VLSQSMRVVRNTLERGDGSAERLIRGAAEAAGITIGGSAPYDVAVHDSRFYGRVVRDGSLGLGESYMDGWWDCPAVDQMIARMVRADLRSYVAGNLSVAALAIKARLLNMQSTSRAYDVGRRHYDIGNDLYAAMLDRRMTYSCGYWRDAADLDAAQEAKLDLVCRKIGLREGMCVLDIGCGFGSFAKFAAERYGARVTGLTVSERQRDLGRALCAGLPVDIRLEDYRATTGHYDAVVSIGMVEHVGYRNYRTYMDVVKRCLAPGAVAFVQPVGGNRSSKRNDPWIHSYIFPNAVLPSVAQLARATEGLFAFEDLHNFGPDYDRTLMAWHANFQRAWPELAAAGRYDERFRRMWSYYLLMSAGGFRSRDTQLYQIVLSNLGARQPECRQA